MKALWALLRKSPFGPLQAHMEKAKACVDRLPPLFAAAIAHADEDQKKLIEEICKLESEADEIKNEIRLHLPKSLFLPVDRGDILEILTLQDSIADASQEVAITFSLRETSFHADLEKPLQQLLKEVTGACSQVRSIVQELDELLETGFGGKEAEKVLSMVDGLNTDEAIADDAGIVVARKLFSLESELSPIDIMILYQILRQVRKIAHLAEGIGNRFRLLLAT